MDYSKLKMAELQKHKTMLDAAIAERQAAERDELKARMAKMAAASGLSLDDIFGKPTAGKRKRAIVKPKYRDPKTGATWSGRGRAPRWINGKDREAFRI